MSPSLAVICHQLTADKDHTTNQLLNGIASQGVDTTLFSSQDVAEHIDALEQFNGFIFEASSSRSMDIITDAFNRAALLKKEAGLWRDKLAAGFSRGKLCGSVSLRAMMDFSFFCNSQNMIWLSSGIETSDFLYRHGANHTSLGSSPVLEAGACQAYRHGQYLAQVANNWKPDN